MTNGSPKVGLKQVFLDWGRIGCIGFGGPPTHIALLKKLCVDERQWIEPHDFEDSIAICNLLPGPASTQLAILCASRVAGRRGAIVGGVAFIFPGLLAIIALSACFLVSMPPNWVLALGAGAGASIAAVAIAAGLGLALPSWKQTTSRSRWITYLLLGGASAVIAGPFVVVILLTCGFVELTSTRTSRMSPVGLLGLVGTTAATGSLAALAWVAFKVGALSYGGGFVIIPLMQHDAVSVHHWMTETQFLNAVALGQVTPGPVVLTVSAVGYAAAGIGGALMATLVAFAPSFCFVLAGANQLDKLKNNKEVIAFLRGAGPAAVGAIFGAAIPLARGLTELWQFGILVCALGWLIGLRRGVVSAIVFSAILGLLANGIGLPMP